MAKILVLDDDEVSGRLLGHMLRRSGHGVDVTLRSEDAWRRMSESPVDLLILDTELEEEQGWDFLVRIRGDVILQDLPVVVHSTNSRRDVIERYIRLGVGGILVKPCSADRLNHDVERLIRHSWCDQLFESEDVVQSRTGLTTGGVRKLYRDALEQLAESEESVTRLAEMPDDAGGLARLNVLKSCAANIGYRRMEHFIDVVREAAASRDQEKVATVVGRFVVLSRILESRVGDEASPALHPETNGAVSDGDGAQEAGPVAVDTPAA